MNVRVLKSMSWVFALAIAALTPIALSAQDSAKPAAKPMASDSTSPSRWDIFLGYSYISPYGTVNNPLYYSSSETVPTHYVPVNLGAIGSISYYFNKNLGIQIEGDAHPNPANCSEFDLGVPGHSLGVHPEAFIECNPTTTQPADAFYGGSAGVIYRWPGERFTPFVHALGGGEIVNGPFEQPAAAGWVMTLGGGLDWETGWWNHHFAIRLFQADYQYIDPNFGEEGGIVHINAIRASTGIVFHIGNLAPPPPVTLACSISPSWVYPGDPATVTATAGNLNTKETAVYSWSGNGVKGSGGATATVDTGSLAPGSYDVKATVVEGKGDKAYETATCTASLTVKAYEPPTITCMANPSTIKPGDTSTITSAGVSPQNRPLTYSYSAAAGTVSGTDTTATFNSTGAPVGPVTVNCNVADDKGGTATASTTVTIAAPAMPPVPHAEALCSITFEKDPKRPERVDNDAKACLDEVALDLQKQTDATVVVVGDSTDKEKAPMGKHAKAGDDAAQRAVNTKDYLVTEKGIDASRIMVKTGGTDAQEVQNYLVPSGADFATDVQGTTAVDESMVKPQTRKALPTRAEPKKKAEAAPAPPAQ